MNQIPKPGEIYQHFKGNKYKIITLAQDTETGDILVIYQAIQGEQKTFAREVSMFMSEVDHVKYPNVTQKNRFEKIEEAPSAGDLSEETTKKLNTNSMPDAAGSEPAGVQLDAGLMEYLDADTYEKRLEVLTSMKDRLTNEMINTMAVAIDVEIDDGDVEKRYEELKYCLLTREKFECNRLR